VRAALKESEDNAEVMAELKFTQGKYKYKYKYKYVEVLLGKGIFIGSIS